jgi:hypothetical protein
VSVRTSTQIDVKKSLTKVVPGANLSDDCKSVQFSVEHGLSISASRFRNKKLKFGDFPPHTVNGSGQGSEAE